MSLSKLEKNERGFICPKCNLNLKFVDGGAVRIINGKLDMDNAKAKYECQNCRVFYREVMNTGYYDVFKMEDAIQTPAALTELRAKRFCPLCGVRMAFKPGDSENVVDYRCPDCGVVFQETSMSDDRHRMVWTAAEKTQNIGQPVIAGRPVTEVPQTPAAAPAKQLKNTGDLPPMMLKKDAEGHCECPRCGGTMNYIEGGAVQIINGRAEFDNVYDHFNCPECNSMFRRIVGTDFFQYSEK